MAQQNYQRVYESSLLILAIALLSILAGATAASSSHSPQRVANGLRSGQTLSGALVWRASVSGTPDRVTFSIDGQANWTERDAPYVFDGDGSRLDTSALANGPHTFTVTAYPSHGARGAVSASVIDVVSNTPAPPSPVESTALPVITGTPVVGESLTATSGSWSGATPITFNYQWMLCDNTGDNCTTSQSGAATYPLTAAAQGSEVRVTVTASNPAGSGTASSEATTVVTPSPSAPAATAPPVVSGNRVVGQTLTTTEGSWTGAAPIAYSNHWQRCDESGTGCTDISGAAGTTYTLQPTDATHTIRVTVIATNAGGMSAARSAALGPLVLAPAPVTTTTNVSPPSTTTTAVTTTTPKTTTTTGTPTSAPPPASPPPAGGVWAWAASSANLDPSSASKIAAFQTYAVAKGTYFVAAVAWINAPAGTPSYSVPITGQAVTSITAPIPNGTKPGDSNDHSLTVHSASGTDYDFGLAQYDSSSGKITSTDGAAIVAPGAAYETGPDSANAARFPLAAGLITPADIKAGVIDHPLVFSMPSVGPAPNPYPANTTVGYPGNPGLPLGSWLRLDPSVNVAALGLPPLETEIAVALQKYGMFLRDIGSTVGIYATDQVNQGGNAVDWPAVGVNLTSSTPSGVPYARGISSNFPWNKLQLLQPPSS